MATRPTTTIAVGEAQRQDRSLLCTVLEAAALLGVGRTSVYELMKTGDLQSVKIGARRLIPRASIESFVADLLEAS